MVQSAAWSDGGRWSSNCLPSLNGRRRFIDETLLTGTGLTPPLTVRGRVKLQDRKCRTRLLRMKTEEPLKTTSWCRDDSKWGGLGSLKARGHSLKTPVAPFDIVHASSISLRNNYVSILHHYWDIARWHGGVTGRVLDLRSKGRGFKSYSGQSCVTTLGKLFTPMCLCHPAI